MRIPYRGAGIAFIRLYNGKLQVFAGKRSKHPFINTLCIPGGGYEPFDKTDFQNAKRETLEETGISVSDKDNIIGTLCLKIPFFKWNTFFILTDRDFKEAVPCEFSFVKWFDISDIKRQIMLRPFTRLEINKAQKFYKAIH